MFQRHVDDCATSATVTALSCIYCYPFPLSTALSFWQYHRLKKMRSTTLGDTSSPSSAASLAGCGPVKARRHVGFFLERTEEEETKESEKAAASRGPVRRGMQATMTAGEHLAWSARVAESEALRQRALQCGEDIARVASGLGYEVVAHTPTAFLKRNSASAAASAAAVAKPEIEPRSFSAADSTPARRMNSAAPLSLPSAAAPCHLPPVFLVEDGGSCSCSSRSSSPGTEEQVGLVPVLSPLLHTMEPERHLLAEGETAVSYEVMLPHALSSASGVLRYAPDSIPAHVTHPHEPRRTSVSEVRGTSFGPLRENSPAVRAANTTNAAPLTTVNSVGVRSAPSTAQSSSTATPSPRQSLTPRRAVLTRHHGSLDALQGSNQSLPHRRASTSNRVSARVTTNANTSVGTDYLNGPGQSTVPTAQNSNHPFTPSTDALNTPAVRVADDDIWPRLYGRPIQ